MEFSKKIFSDKLKEEAERLGKDLGGLGKAAGISNLYLYSQTNSKIPRADTLQKLAVVGVDINYLLINAPAAFVTIGKEPTEEYMSYNTLLADNKKLNTKIDELKLMAFDLQEDNKNLRRDLAAALHANEHLIEELQDLHKGTSKSPTQKEVSKWKRNQKIILL